MSGLRSDPTTPSYNLTCLLKGDKTTFDVEIPADMRVSRLKEAIHTKAIGDGKFPLAKNLVLWKVDLPWSSDGIFLENIDIKEDEGAEVLAGYEVSEHWQVQPPTRKIHVFVVLPATEERASSPNSPSGLKRKREPLDDITESLLSRWFNLIIALPTSSHDLMAYLNKPLEEDEKIPLSSYSMSALLSEGEAKIRCSKGDLQQVFRLSEHEHSYYLWTSLTATILTGAPDSNGTESSFHSFWDDNIRKIINQILIPNQTVRDSNHGTSTASLKPDFGVLLEGVCAFRGEEKAPHYSGNHPKQELLDKLVWTYDPAPWILGYHAVGAEVTLSAIYPSSIIDLGMLDLSYRSKRIENIRRMIKLAPLLRLIQKAIGPRNYPEFIPITRETGTVIEISSSCVKKTYNGKDQKLRIAHLREIYDLLRLKNVPNVDSALSLYDDSHHGTVAYLQPKGVNRGPTSAQEVLEAVLCLLEALIVMHANPNPLFHRDIRWPNIILSPNNHSKWFLIDWDDAAIAPTRAAKHLYAKSHSPACHQNNHGAEVDIWGVGKLILDARYFIFKPAISDNLVTIGTQMVDGLIITAKDAQTLIRQLL